jgi:EAL domain-containing protein (putative c-di-GMP-specific phosphodiesterase class I)
LLENIEQNDVIIVSKKLNSALSEAAVIRGNTTVSTASIGISTFPQDGDAVQHLLKNADLAMYQAKENKNSFQFYNHEMSVRVEKQMELTSYLRSALQNDVFQLYYQPQVNSATGKVTGMEALLRLPHPEKKWISPAEFIPIAEKTGLITSIDEWVLRTAGGKIRELVDSGYPDIIMAVNLSTRQLHQSNLFAILQAIIKENNLDPGCLELEISEGSIFQNMDTTFSIMSKLKALGIKLAIDDFGTGYASLNYLSYFPLDTLKIDLSFTKKILFSKSDAAIVTGVIAIANNLGLNVIVEGVEKEEQLKFFSALKCHIIQGYIFSPAVPGGEINNLLNKGFAQR